jgi:hypothetical protein
LTDVGTSSPPYGNSHRLLATATPAGAGTDFHNSPTMDGATPRDGSNVPIYKPVWIYMMTGGTVTGIKGRAIPRGIAAPAGLPAVDALGRERDGRSAGPETGMKPGNGTGRTK